MFRLVLPAAALLTLIAAADLDDAARKVVAAAQEAS